MMIAALLLASAQAASAVDAEVSFARDAKRIGQWSAFRKWADTDAVMFTPQAVWAALRERTNRWMKHPTIAPRIKISTAHENHAVHTIQDLLQVFVLVEWRNNERDPANLRDRVVVA